MKTDECWLERGGNGPYWAEGCELMQVYLDIMDAKGAKRKDTLIVPYNKAIKANLGRPYIINGTTTDTVKLVMMSGAEFEVSLNNVESYADLMSNAVKLVKPKNGNESAL